MPKKRTSMPRGADKPDNLKFSRGIQKAPRGMLIACLGVLRCGVYYGNPIRLPPSLRQVTLMRWDCDSFMEDSVKRQGVRNEEGDCQA